MTYMQFYIHYTHIYTQCMQVSSLETNVAHIGEKLASLIDMVSSKSDKYKGEKYKIKEILPLVSITK